MTYNLKKEAEKKERLAGGHRLCAGCGAGITVRGVLRALDPEDKAVVVNATSCLEVSTFMYPYTAYEDSFIHSAFENAAATAAGVETAYKVLQQKGRINENFKVIAFGGDGGTYDIGLQSLSGAIERNHDFVYVCYDNEAYMNTGIQRSSSTPRFADATTSPAGSKLPGKQQNKKDLTAIIAAHGSPYVAQTAFIGNMGDLHEKSRKAIYTEGANFLNVLSPCPRGWRYNAADIAHISKMAVDTCVWPLFEIEDGVYRLTYEPKKKLPVEEFLKLQGRFSHMFKKSSEWMIEEAQSYVDKKWEQLLNKCR